MSLRAARTVGELAANQRPGGAVSGVVTLEELRADVRLAVRQLIVGSGVHSHGRH
jgi:hypothetical protein